MVGHAQKISQPRLLVPGSAAGAAALIIRLRRLPTSGLPYERPRATRALRWGAPPTADPPTPGPEKHQKSFRRVGESFLAGIRVAHKRLQEHSPPPPFWGYLKSEKSAVLTHFSDDFSLFESHVLTSFAGAMQKRRKCCKYQYFLDPRCTKHRKYQCFWKPSKKTL